MLCKILISNMIFGCKGNGVLSRFSGQFTEILEFRGCGVEMDYFCIVFFDIVDPSSAAAC